MTSAYRCGNITFECYSSPPLLPQTGSSVKPQPTLDAFDIISRLLEAQSRAFEGYCDLNTRYLKTEDRLAKVREAIKSTNSTAGRSEFHRGWRAACDMMLAVLDKQ